MNGVWLRIGISGLNFPNTRFFPDLKKNENTCDTNLFNAVFPFPWRILWFS